MIGENPTKARVFKPGGALLLWSGVSRGLDFEFQTHSLAFRCLNRRDLWRWPGSAALLDLNFTYTSLAGGFHRQHVPQDMLLRSEEVQYVC